MKTFCVEGKKKIRGFPHFKEYFIYLYYVSSSEWVKWQYRKRKMTNVKHHGVHDDGSEKQQMQSEFGIWLLIHLINVTFSGQSICEYMYINTRNMPHFSIFPSNLSIYLCIDILKIFKIYYINIFMSVSH